VRAHTRGRHYHLLRRERRAVGGGNGLARCSRVSVGLRQEARQVKREEDGGGRRAGVRGCPPVDAPTADHFLSFFVVYLTTSVF